MRLTNIVFLGLNYRITFLDTAAFVFSNNRSSWIIKTILTMYSRFWAKIILLDTVGKNFDDGGQMEGGREVDV